MLIHMQTWDHSVRRNPHLPSLLNLMDPSTPVLLPLLGMSECSFCRHWKMNAQSYYYRALLMSGLSTGMCPIIAAVSLTVAMLKDG